MCTINISVRVLKPHFSIYVDETRLAFRAAFSVYLRRPFLSVLAAFSL